LKVQLEEGALALHALVTAKEGRFAIKLENWGARLKKNKNGPKNGRRSGLPPLYELTDDPDSPLASIF